MIWASARTAARRLRLGRRGAGEHAEGVAVEEGGAEPG